MNKEEYIKIARQAVTAKGIDVDNAFVYCIGFDESMAVNTVVFATVKHGYMVFVSSDKSANVCNPSICYHISEHLESYIERARKVLASKGVDVSGAEMEEYDCEDFFLLCLECADVRYNVRFDHGEAEPSIRKIVGEKRIKI